MGPLPLADLSKADRKTLLNLANATISHGVINGEKLSANSTDYPAPLQAMRACFVTLHLHNRLRGCIGTLQAEEPLVIAVINAAFGAAFEDPRFAAVATSEVAELEIDISVLSQADPLVIQSEEQLLEILRPGVDGLIIEEGRNRATFLPTVWEQLPRAADFVNQLKQKAGFPTDYWSDGIQVSRYTTENFPPL